MRMLTVSNIKKNIDSKNKEPKEGSTLRFIYDFLLSNKGNFVDIPIENRVQVGNCLRQLEDFYGFDIERKRTNSCFLFRLNGEFFDNYYISYLNYEQKGS